MTKCGADTPFGFAQGRLVREKPRYWCCTHADKSVRATRASRNAVGRKEIAQ
jgi:hypothetical protein